MPYQILPTGPFSTDFLLFFSPGVFNLSRMNGAVKLFGPSGRSPFYGCKGKTAFCLHILQERKPINVENDYWFSFNRATDVGISVDIWYIMCVFFFFVWCVDKEFQQTTNLSTSLICIFCVPLVLFSPYKRNCNPADIFLYTHLAM